MMKIPEKILSISGVELSQEEVDNIQRQLQEAMSGNYTQIPVIPKGAKAEWIDLTTEEK